MLFSSAPASAYTFLVVDSTAAGPAPYRWDPGKPITYRVDRGDLSATFKNADGLRLIQTAFDRWQNATWGGQRTVGLNIQYLGLTDTDITRGNYAQYEGQTVIIFDTDGSIINAMLGGGTTGEVLGFAEATSFDEARGLITSARATFNGATISRPGLGDFEATVVHELGHFLGLGHTYVAHDLKNGDPSDDGPIPTMFPTSLDDDTQMRTPELDDFAGLGAIYGTQAFQEALGRIEGAAAWSDGLPVLGGHVEARSLSDPKLRVGGITGYLEDGTGGYQVFGVPPGDYRVTMEAIPSQFGEASGIGPYEPAARDVFSPVTYRTPSETSDFTRVTASAGQASAVTFTVGTPGVPSGQTATRFSRLTPVALEDAAVTTDTVKVPSSLRIKDLSVFVDIAHQYVGDLKISLTSPSGRTVILISYVGASGNLIESTFTRQKTPELSRFIDEDAAGTWTLTVVDSEAEDVGVLRRWWLTVVSAEAGSRLLSDFNGSGQVDFDDFFLFAAAFGTKQGGAGFDAKYDLDGGGTVDFNDFFLFAADFGKKA